MKTYEPEGGGRLILYYEEGDYYPADNPDTTAFAITARAMKSSNSVTVSNVHPVPPKDPEEK